MGGSRRQFIIGAGAATAASVAWPQAGGELTPEMFGAKGDGRTNDSRAFAALSAQVNRRGGGTIVLRPRTYIVGEQFPGGKFAFSPSDILSFGGCRGPIVIRGNGAVLRCAPGLLFGGFDRSGKALPDSRANVRPPNQAVPYIGMIYADGCSGSIVISDIELDGNLAGLRPGGKYDPRGWSAGASGIALFGQRGPVRISNVHSHHHGTDGMLFMPPVDSSASTTVVDSTCDYNARQGCTISSGRNYAFQRCRFRRSGTAVFKNAPCAGFDIEAEKGPIRDVSFSDCEFSDNVGMGVAVGGDVDAISFDRCKFIGTRHWAAWPATPGIRFTNCLFVGTINRVHGEADPARAVHFAGCTFTDDPALSPTGQVFLQNGWIAVVEDGPNVQFSDCRFRLVADGILPRSISSVIYQDCIMSQRSARPSAPRGTYVGTNLISGNARLDGSIIKGIVRLNGRLVPRTS